MKLLRIGILLTILAVLAFLEYRHLAPVAGPHRTIMPIEGMDGTLVLEAVGDGPEVANVVFSNRRTADDCLGRLDKLPPFQRLYLDNSNVQDATLLELKKYPSIQYVDLGLTNVTDKGVENLRDQSNIVELSLRQCPRLTDACIEPLKAMTHLHKIMLWGNRISPTALESLRKDRPDMDVISKGPTDRD
jgi:hypothetical protein